MRKSPYTIIEDVALELRKNPLMSGYKFRKKYGYNHRSVKKAKKTLLAIGFFKL